MVVFPSCLHHHQPTKQQLRSKIVKALEGRWLAAANAKKRRDSAVGKIKKIGLLLPLHLIFEAPSRGEDTVERQVQNRHSRTLEVKFATVSLMEFVTAR